MMGAANKKKIDAVLLIDPKAEMGGKQIDWLRKYPELEKKMKPVEYSEKIELDSRKWDKKKLSKALYALARYELKQIAVRAADWQKKDEKKGSNVEKDILDKLPKYYLKTVKKIKDKCSIALEELEKDLGDNKKGLRDGKAALKKLGSVDPKKIFSVPRKATAFAFRDLAAAIKKAGEDGKKKDEAFKKATKTAAEARKGFDGDGKDAQAAIKFLLKAASDIKKNKEANALLKEFGRKVEKLAKHLALFVYKLDEFESELDDAAKALKKGEMTEAEAKAMSGRIAAFTSLDKAGSKVQGALTYLKSEFAKVEKQLK